MRNRLHDLLPWLRRLLKVVAIMISLFVGLMIATAGGAIFPKLLQVAAPFACPDGQMEIVSQGYSYKPGQSGVSRSTYCVNELEGTSTDITLSVLFYSFLIYSSLLAVPVLIIVSLLNRRLKRTERAALHQYGNPQLTQVQDILDQFRKMGSTIHVQTSSTAHKDEGDAAMRLKQLQELYENRLITDEEKKKEILSRL